MESVARFKARSAALFVLFLSSIICLYIWPSSTEKHSLSSIVPRDDTRVFQDDSILTSNQSIFSRADGDYSCSKDKPCSNHACCGEGGYCGYGPTYCGDGCQADCDAVAECGEYAEPKYKKCPLNVCCSQYGFCGTTEDFCNDECQSGCDTPSVPAGRNSGSVRDKVIVYYEAWSARRKCKPFTPYSIPTDGITHVNFAFAYIDPDSFEVTTMDSQTPESLFQDATAIKSMKSGLGVTLEVFVSIGGWTFSDNGTATQPVFGEIASSEENRQKFADNLVTFMVRYGFDGVDLDWEYPGAPDRGGTNDDKENFVKLIRTLRKTFDDSPRGGYGLTFTIPSSYWYLQHFDVPALIDAGASWVNLMSYDLHGVWDRNNPIGSIVQGHSNLTEIKSSVELLWRSDVPPSKVVLGTGFYGRSFTLEDPECDTPGCIFSGAANKGDCTDEGGILGFFEIQEILENGENIDKIHDKEAAVKYFKFDKDQWVSYDDTETFDQKVEWADSIGLGGLMSWAIDLDDQHFTALSGLIGKDAGEGHDSKSSELTLRELQGASWSSDNGQDCYATQCNEHCPIDMTTIDTFPSNCNGYKHICCPRDRAPRDCLWRGGESGGPGRACHGQCHNGELTLLYDGYGSRHCATGKQAFCCTADRYKDLVEGCQLGDCGGSCDKFPGTTEVAKQYDFGRCWNHALHGYKRPMCCKQPLEGCHWVGKGGCGDNNCDADDVQIALSAYGSSSTRCSLAGRKKSLCCNAPDRAEPFTPVPLEYLFPEVPDVTDPVKWDLQILGGPTNGGGGDVGGKNELKDPNFGPFGFVLIAGPEDVVSSFSKRDESHIEFADCSAITSTERQTTRVFCMDDSPDSNCDQVLQGGLEGTVVRMPEQCGPGQYIVAHSLETSADQSLPAHLAGKVSSNRPVMDLEFSYDFGLMKRADEKVYLRIDYSNQPGYWEELVDSPGEKRKRSTPPHELSQRDLHKRFFSEDSASWGRKFDRVDSSDFFTDFTELVNLKIVNEKLTRCNDEYLQLSSIGSCNVKAKWGFSMVGTLQPFSLDQSYGFIDLNYDLDTIVTLTGDVGMDTEYKHSRAFIVPRTLHGFSHPGLISFKPTFDLDIGISAKNASFAGDFSAAFRSQTASDNKGYIRQTFPYSAGGTRGSTKAYLAEDSFEGHMKVRHGEVKLSITPKFNMAIDVDKSATSSLSKRDGDAVHERADIIGGSFRDIAYVAQFSGYNGLSWDSNGIDVNVDSIVNSLISRGGSSIDSWEGSEGIGDPIGSAPGSVQIHKQGSDEKDDVPKFENRITPWTLFSTDVLTCTEDEEGTPLCGPHDFCADGSVPCKEIGTASRPHHSNSERRSLHVHKHQRRSRHSRGHAVEPKLSEDGTHAQDIEDIDEAVNALSLTSDPNSRSLFTRKPLFGTGGPRDPPYKSECVNKQTKQPNAMTYTNHHYPSSRDWEETDERYDNGYNVRTLQSCSDGVVTGHSLPDADKVVKGVDPDFYTEHIVELQTMSIFLQSIRDNKLPGGGQYGLAPIYCDFLHAAFDQKASERFLPRDVSPPPVGPDSRSPIDRILHAQGSTYNWEVFVLLEAEMNGFKERLWADKQPRAQKKATEANTDVLRSSEARKNIRFVINVFSYLNVKEVQGKMIGILNEMRKEMQLADKTWTDKSNPSTGIVKYWDKWADAHFKNMVSKGRKFVNYNIAALREFWLEQPDTAQKVAVLADIDILEGYADLVKINLDGLHTL